MKPLKMLKKRLCILIFSNVFSFFLLFPLKDTYFISRAWEFTVLNYDRFYFWFAIVLN